MKKFYFFIVYFLFPLVAYSQWSGDPSVNTAICNINRMQFLPKVAATPDGGSYISWFDGRSGNLDVYIQRLNAQGVKQFAQDGLLVSSHPQNTWIGDYDLISDANNNAILVFSDIRNSSSDTIVNPFAYKISPSGNFLWGANGVPLTAQSNSYQMWPKAAISNDGSIFVTWWMAMGDNSTIFIQKLSESGILQWANPTVFVPAVMTKVLYPDIVGSDNGSAIVSFASGPIDTSGSFIPNLKTILAYKISSAGTIVWSKDVYTHEDPTIPPYVVPVIYPDGNNGAYFSWFYGITFERITSAINHISSAGSYLLSDTIAIVSTNDNGQQFAPYLTFNPSTGDIYAFWTESNLGQQVWGLYGQRFSSTGARLWSDTGRTFVPLGVPQQYYINANYYNGNVIVGYEEEIAGNNQQVKGFSVNESGNMSWGIIPVSNVESVKSYLAGSMTPSGMTIFTWGDSRGGNPNQSGIYAQNLNANGTLGPVGINVISSSIPDVYRLYQNYPNPFNPSTNIRFNIPESGIVLLKIFDITGKEITTLVNESMQPGEYNYQLTIDSYQLSSGVYFYTLKTEKFSETKRMMLLK